MLKHRTLSHCQFLTSSSDLELPASSPNQVSCFNISMPKSKENVKTSDTKDPHTLVYISIANNKTNVKT